MIIKHGRHIFGEIHEVRKGTWAFFLDCSFRMLIGWADKLQSRGSNERFTAKFCYSISSVRSILFRTLHFPPSSFSACLARALVCLILNFS